LNTFILEVINPNIIPIIIPCTSIIVNELNPIDSIELVLPKIKIPIESKKTPSGYLKSADIDKIIPIKAVAAINPAIAPNTIPFLLLYALCFRKEEVELIKELRNEGSEVSSSLLVILFLQSHNRY